MLAHTKPRRLPPLLRFSAVGFPPSVFSRRFSALPGIYSGAWFFRPYSPSLPRESSPRHHSQDRLDPRLFDDGGEHQIRRHALSDRRDHVLSRLLHLDSADELAVLSPGNRDGLKDEPFLGTCAAQSRGRDGDVLR